jgi:hypothetical protein
MSDVVDPQSTGKSSVRLAALEVVCIFLSFFLFAGSQPPDVGESHYLVKAKHYWQPDWCASDLFLESRDAHATFYWTLGWITRLVSLPATAWFGRVITWLLLAWSWRRLSWAIVPRPLISLLSAGLMLFFLRNFHLAGEWIVGGVEAKGFAYVLVFLALEAASKNQWRAALLLAGAAGAFHVLVGGWTAVALGLAWLVSRGDRPRLMSLLPAAAGGVVLALPGLVPALLLNRGVEETIAREGARIYVFERLSHHLVYHLFSASHIARFQLLVVSWAVVAWLLRSESPLARVQRVAAGAVVVALIGTAIDQGTVIVANLRQWSPDEYELWVAPIMRYYWFRMSDSLVPIGLALAAVAELSKLQASRPVLANWLLVLAILVAAVNVADVFLGRAEQPVPGAILQPRPTADSGSRSWLLRGRPDSSAVTAAAWYRDWRAVCEWAANQMPAGAVVLTPREQQTFKWYAGRAEVVNWKDVPQDARGLVEWKQRLADVYPRKREHHRHDLAAFSDAELVALAQKYRAGYIIVDLTRSRRRIGLPRLYASFGVYRVPPVTEP